MTDSIIKSFKECMAEHGLLTDEAIIADGVLHRIHLIGDKRGSLNGAYVLHLDAKPSGWFQNFKSGLAKTWTLSGNKEPMSHALLQKIMRERECRKAAEERKHRIAACEAYKIYSYAKAISSRNEHPYLIKKRIDADRGRLHRDLLVVPIYEEYKRLTSIQFIRPDGSKRFLPDGKIKGCFSTIGSKPDKGAKIFICEGWASGMALHRESKQLVIVAFSASNLETVAKKIRRLHPDNEIVIAGDNDESGIGQKAAIKAAMAIGGKYIIPKESGHDFWDQIIGAKL